MKLRNKLAAITAAAMLAFTGVGFAAWTFTQVENAEIDSVTDKVAVGIELTNDSFALYTADGSEEITALYLICDAPTTAVANQYLAGEGVYWSTSATGKNGDVKDEITQVCLKGTLSKDNEDSVWDKESVTVAFTADYSELESDYITFGSAPSINNKVVTVANNANVQSDAFTLPTVAYTPDALAISSITELTAMNNALASELNDKALTFTAQIIA